MDFVNEYMDYAATLTDAPDEFHNFMALGILSTVIGNQAYIPFGTNRVYPNLWIILLAQSSFFRKSTSLTLGTRLLRDMHKGGLILPDEFSREQLVQNLAKQSRGLFVWSELSSIISNFRREYMGGTIEMLTHLYDCPSRYERQLRTDTYVIEDACINIWAASTLEWFTKCFKEAEISGGFLPRFLYVAPKAKQRFIAMPVEPDKKKEQELKNKLYEVAQVGQLNAVRFDMSGITKDYTEWVESHENEIDTTSEGSILSGFWTRLEAYCLKLSMLYELSDSGGAFIQVKAFNRARATVELVKDTIKELVEDRFTFTRDQASSKKILGIIRLNKGIRHSQLLQNSHMLIKELRPIVETLEQAGLIEVRDEGRTKSYWPS